MSRSAGDVHRETHADHGHDSSDTRLRVESPDKVHRRSSAHQVREPFSKAYKMSESITALRLTKVSV